MNVLLNIPEVHQINLLTSWLHWRDVGRLDSALCNRKSRSEFRNSIRSEYCAFTQPLKWGCNKIPLKWILNRGIKLSEFKLDLSILEDLCLKSNVLNQFGATLRTVTIHLTKNNEYVANESSKVQMMYFNLTQLFAEIAECCPQLDKVVVFGSHDRLILLNNVLTLPPPLTTLHLYDIPITKGWLLAIATAPHLHSLQLINCTSSFITVTTPVSRSLRVLSCADTRLCAMCPFITSLVLTGLSATDIHTIVHNCPHVSKARLSLATGKLDEADARIIAEHWRCLQHFCVSGATEQAVLVLVMQCPALVRLIGNGCVVDTVPDITYPANYTGSRLRVLSMECNYGTTLQTIVTHCSNLHTVHLYAVTYHISLYDAAIEEPAPKDYVEPVDVVEKALHYIVDTNIHTLCLCDYTSLKGDDLLTLQCAQLTKFSVKNSWNLCDSAILALLPTLPQLHTFHIENCYGLPVALVLQIPSLCTTLRDFTYNNYNGWSCNSVSQAPSLFRDFMKIAHPQITKCFISC